MRNMLDGIGYDCIRKDRREGIGGGVALVYDTSELSFQQLKTGTEHEIVAALGRRTGQRRKVVAMSVYIPPNLDADQSDSVMQKVSEHIGTFKRRYSSPYFIIGGDFNKRNIQRELRGYPDLKLVITPPTRGVNTLDLIFTNFPDLVTQAGVTEPICNLAGTETDHLTVYVNARIPRVPEYKVESYSYLKQTKEGDELLKRYLNNYDWSNIRGTDVDGMVDELH